jgi:2-oxoisovalerate dehydrogenase E1 component beta subunit
MATKTYLEAIRDTLQDEMTRDESVFILGEDVGKTGGVFRATEGLQEKFGAARVIDAPLAELAIVGVAIGAAAVGMRPVAEIQFADFIHPAFDQIVNEAAKMRYRTNGAWTFALVIRTPYGGGIHDGLYHSPSIEAFFCHVPGLKIVVPSSPFDAKGLLAAATRTRSSSLNTRNHTDP